MQKFNCLEIDCPLFGPHLLEASAGTGKTFTIEHVFVRLILSGIPLEEILVVTFTRAATRELKHRIRENLEKALFSIQEETPALPYLEPHRGSKHSLLLINQALCSFDEASIFTIHGFCFRMLQKFSIESGELMLSEDPDHPFEMTKKTHFALQRFFLEGISEMVVSAEQISLLLQKYETLKELQIDVAKTPLAETSGKSFYEANVQFLTKLEDWKDLDVSKLLEDFEQIRGNFKAKKGNFEAQVEALAERDFKKLLIHSGSLFSFLSPENKKLTGKKLHEKNYPEFFSFAEKEIGPLVESLSNSKNILSTLSYLWHQFAEDLSSPDLILKQMNESLQKPCFLEKLQESFQAIIIDEFQDTDPLQWEIFSKAFIEKKELKALYLVGDPKQSIYRFRSADVYTYYAAKKILGEKFVYLLDTNYRSSKDLIGSLNVLFSKNFLKLPKTGEEIGYVPVLAGSEIVSEIEDEKKALHFFIGDKNASFQSSFLPYAIAEIEKLKNYESLSIAVLVKDRYDAKAAVDFLQQRGVDAVARSHEPLGKTKEFRFLREFLAAVCNPSDETACLIASDGPYGQEKSFSYWRSFIEEHGLAKFFTLVFFNVDLSADQKQILEEIFSWQQREGFSFDGLLQFINEFERLGSDEGAFKKVQGKKEAVQVLTLHVSKGLEFDVVFALALASGGPLHDEEAQEYNAEKLRQLYVAMTRAKQRLYVPFKRVGSEKRPSPMDLFCKEISMQEDEFISFIETHSKSASISWENIPDSVELGPKRWVLEYEPQEKRIAPYYEPSYIQSFTSLKKGTEHPLIEFESDEILPRGKETGTLVHAIFEKIFSSNESVWTDEIQVEEIVEKLLMGTFLEEQLCLVQVMVQKMLCQPLFDGQEFFCLRDLHAKDVAAEVEFFFTCKQNYFSGSIDLVFKRKGKLYFIDWKTNTIRTPTPDGVKEVMKSYNYDLQASIYKEAIDRSFEGVDFGGAFYIFVRTGAYIHFVPKKHEYV